MWYFYKMGCGGFTKVMKFASRWKADRVALWGCLYFFAAFPVAALLPAWAGWENGPLEIAQDIILLAGAMGIALCDSARRTGAIIVACGWVAALIFSFYWAEN